jgi:hypothetical protein
MAQALDKFNNAWNQLHADVCGRGLNRARHPHLCADVTTARDEWRVVWSDWTSSALPILPLVEWSDRYDNLRRAAKVALIDVKAPRSPVGAVRHDIAKVKKKVRKAVVQTAEQLGAGLETVGEALLLGAAVFAVLYVASSNRGRGRD